MKKELFGWLTDVATAPAVVGRLLVAGLLVGLGHITGDPASVVDLLRVVLGQ